MEASKDKIRKFNQDLELWKFVDKLFEKIPEVEKL